MNDFWNWVSGNFGNILSVIGLITGFIFYWLSRRPKRFGWQVMTRTPILSARSGHLPLKVMYDGKEVSSPQISVVRVGNTGKIELKREDFDGPVRISFDKSNILQVDISGRSTEEIRPEISANQSTEITFTPTLLNPGEWIDFQLVTDGPLEAPVVHARVAGQGSSSLLDEAERASRKQKAGLSLIFGGMILTLILAIVFQGALSEWVPAVGFVATMSGLYLSNRADASTWRKARRIRKRRSAKVA